MKFKRCIMMLVIFLISSPYLLINAFEPDMKFDIDFNVGEAKVILIDPGHGGIDGGAKSKNGTIEADINLQISLKLKEELECKGYKVFLTRQDNSSLDDSGKTIREKKRSDLKNRCKMKNETKCDLFVSIHQNMFPQEKIFGAQVWHAMGENSQKLATLVQDEIKLSVNDGNKRVAKCAGDDYVILRDKYEGASILVECGFLSNNNEEIKLKSEEHQKAIVNGIVNGIEKFYQ